MAKIKMRSDVLNETREFEQAIAEAILKHEASIGYKGWVIVEKKKAE